MIKALAHITGGGLVENIPRILPGHLCAEIDVATWALPAVFQWLKKTGGVKAAEMGRTFNNGVGMVIVVAKEDAGQLKKFLEDKGETVFVIGQLVDKSDKYGMGCMLRNLDIWG
jgi:phosphoribosylamine--glycine ligase/phosphoribosylformylglycinamidine cyclo-ligase